MSIQSWLNKIWYGGTPPPWWLMPLSGIYGAVSRLRHAAYSKQLRRAAPLTCPVIVIGNLSVGGTGKTPLVCWLTVRLAELGFRPGVVTRGYGGSSRRARLVEASDDPNTVGDEAILLGRRTRAPIAIGRDRPAAAQLLINAGCDVIVSDDGLQHYALMRDCEIVVVDGERLFGNGRLLPAGPLREAPARLKGADAVVVVTAPGLGDEIQALKAACGEEVEAAVKQYMATPKQSTDAMFDYLYAQLTPELRAQREEARRYAAQGH